MSDPGCEGPDGQAAPGPALGRRWRGSHDQGWVWGCRALSRREALWPGARRARLPGACRAVSRSSRPGPHVEEAAGRLTHGPDGEGSRRQPWSVGRRRELVVALNPGSWLLGGGGGGSRGGRCKASAGGDMPGTNATVLPCRGESGAWGRKRIACHGAECWSVSFEGGAGPGRWALGSESKNTSPV